MSERQVSEEQEQEFAESQRGYRRAVIWLCQKYPSAIGDYTRLVNYFWKFIGHLTVKCEHCGQETHIWIDAEQMKKMGRPESICRSYRLAVEQGDIREPESVIFAKHKKQRLFHDYFAGSERCKA